MTGIRTALKERASGRAPNPRFLETDVVSAIDFAALDLTELKQLQRNVAQHVASYEDRRRKEAAAAAREFGFSLSELVTS